MPGSHEVAFTRTSSPPNPRGLSFYRIVGDAAATAVEPKTRVVTVVSVITENEILVSAHVIRPVIPRRRRASKLGIIKHKVCAALEIFDRHRPDVLSGLS